jgi:O-antigen/teichoic acid export membrane protein
VTSIARKSLLPMANVAFGALLGLLALKFMAEYFGPEPYGEFQFGFASVGLVYILTDLSMGDAHTKRVSEGMPAGDCFVTYTWFRVASSLVFVALTLALLFTYTVVLGRKIEDLAVTTIVTCMAYYVAKSIQSVASATFDARLETARSQLGGLVETLVRVALTLAFAFLFASAIPYVGRIRASGALADWVRANPAASIGLAWTAGSLVAAVVLFAYLLRSLERGRFRWDILKSYFAFALPLFLPNSMGLVGFFIDRVMLGVFGTSVNAADFAAPRQIVGVIEGIAVAVGLVLFPAISAAAASGNAQETRGMLDRSMRYLSMALLPAIAFLAFFPGPVLKLALSDQFAGDALVLTVCAVMIYVVVLARPHVNFLMGHGRTKDAARAGLVSAALIIVLNVVLVPDDIKSLHLRLAGLKALGSAIATLVAAVVSYAMLARASRRVQPSPAAWPLAFSFARHLVAAAALGAVVWGAHAWSGITMERWYTLVPYAALGLVAYALVLLATREITREDLAYAKRVLHPGEMAQYLRSELLRRDD